MTKWTAVSIENHIDKCWKLRQNFSFFAGEHVVEVLVTEISELLPHYVLGFTRKDNTFKLSALVGLGGQKNLFTNLNQQWMCEVVPKTLQAFPFSLRSSESSDELVLCLDEDHITSQAEDIPLFQNNGEIAPRTIAALDYLKTIESEKNLTQKAVDILGSNLLIEAWPLNFKISGRAEPLSVQGFHKINENALLGLSEKTLAGIRDNGALTVAYGQLFSMNQVQKLGLRAEYIAKEAENNGENIRELTGIFSEESGSLNFDNINLD